MFIRNIMFAVILYISNTSGLAANLSVFHICSLVKALSDEMQEFKNWERYLLIVPLINAYPMMGSYKYFMSFRFMPIRPLQYIHPIKANMSTQLISKHSN